MHQCASQLNHRRRAGGIVICAVINRVAFYIGPNAEVIEVRGKQNRFFILSHVSSAKYAHYIPRLRSRHIFVGLQASLDGLGRGEGSGAFCRKLPESPPGSNPKPANCDATKSAVRCSSRVPLPRPRSSSEAKKFMSA